eukprot:TRINITY_DN10802_c1_g1_i1.p1 TRINITY_DN10802_c1_g1~~TRINITY_DN10802_c1_g1_i1.p1  ORF type:complete len:351 (+),score=107.33 TRINITY_DN10802_c1_g1_i1:50-1054(+)
MPRGKRNVPKYIGKEPGERIETTVLKRRKRIEAVHADKVRKAQNNVKKKSAAQQRRELRKQVFRNARDFVNNYKRRVGETRLVARRQRTVERKSELTEALTKAHDRSIVFVIRAKGDDIPLVTKRMLEQWDLRRLHEGRLLSLTPDTLRDLNVLRDFVRWGYPSAAHIGHLLRTRAYLYNDSGMRVPLSGNTQIEERLGGSGILCIEDMEYAINERTDQLQVCLDMLCPFRFDPPRADLTEKDRGIRDRNSSIGTASFSAYLVTAMPEIPAPGTDSGELALRERRHLTSAAKKLRREPGVSAPLRPVATVDGAENARGRRLRRRREARAAAGGA